jgi:hypothetical protein
MTRASKRIKFLGINLTKEVYDIYRKLEDTAEINEGKPEYIERHLTIMDQKTRQYSPAGLKM